MTVEMPYEEISLYTSVSLETTMHALGPTMTILATRGDTHPRSKIIGLVSPYTRCIAHNAVLERTWITDGSRSLCCMRELLVVVKEGKRWKKEKGSKNNIC